MAGVKLEKKEAEEINGLIVASGLQSSSGVICDVNTGLFSIRASHKENTVRIIAYDIVIGKRLEYLKLLGKFIANLFSSFYFKLFFSSWIQFGVQVHRILRNGSKDRFDFDYGAAAAIFFPTSKRCIVDSSTINQSSSNRRRIRRRSIGEGTFRRARFHYYGARRK